MLMELVNGFLRRRKEVGMDDADYLKKLEEKGLSDDGSALVPDPTPMAPPIGYQKQPSMVEHIRSLVRGEQLRLMAELEGYETFEESEDFDVHDGFEPSSAYEMEEDFEPVHVLRERLAKYQADEKARADAGSRAESEASLDAAAASKGDNGGGGAAAS